MDQETKYCAYCGGEISADAKKCEHCDEWLDDDSVSRNHVPNNYVSQENKDGENNVNLEDNSENDSLEVPVADSQGSNASNNSNNSNTSNISDISNISNISNNESEQYSKIIPIRRLFLLMLFTLGIYGFYWIYKNNCHLRDDLGKDVNPIVRTILMIVPIVNIIVFYQLLEDLNYFIKEEGISSYSSALNTLIMIFLGGPNSLGMWVLINVQESVNDLWRAKENNLPVRREFNNAEIAVLLIGILIIVFMITFFAFGLAVASVATMYGLY